MTFVIQVRDWLIHVVFVEINQSQTRILKVIINFKKWYVIYLLWIIDMQGGVLASAPYAPPNSFFH